MVQEDTQKEEEKPAVASENNSTAENVIKAVYATEAGGNKAEQITACSNRKIQCEAERGSDRYRDLCKSGQQRKFYL